MEPDIGVGGRVDQSGTGGRLAITTEADRLAVSPHGSVAVTRTSVSYTHLTLPTNREV